MAATAVKSTSVKSTSGKSTSGKSLATPKGRRAKPSSEWQVRAECRGPHATVFFPPQQFERKAERLVRESRAKEICRTCSVASACLEYAIAIREPHGIWGGFNESERRAMLPPKPVAVKVNGRQPKVPVSAGN